METPTHCNVVTPSTSASTSHAFDHYAGTLHAYALEVTSQKVFNFAEQGFVHRLVSAKGDGKIVQLAGGESSMEPSEWMDEEEEMLWNRKLEGLAAEYNEMLRHELEKTRIYYQEKILAIKSLYRNKEKEEASTSDYVDSLKAKEKVLRKRAKAATEKLEKGQKDLGFVTNLVESLQKNKTGNKEVIMAAENELEKVREMYNETIPQLEAKVNQLMLLLDGG
jgi:BRCA1-associated protein